jgi:hypothetical protein
VRLAKAERDHTDRPVFAVAAQYARKGESLVTVTMLAGPTKIRVTAQYVAESRGPTFETPHGDAVYAVNRTVGSRSRAKDLIKSEQMRVRIRLPEGSETGSVKISLFSEEVGGDQRRWSYDELVRWEGPPDISANPMISLGGPGPSDTVVE